MGRYTKDVEGVDHFYQPEDLYKYAGEPFDIRVSILDERPDAALWVNVPEDDISRSIGEILDELVIGANPKQTEFIRENLLDLEEFPHLSDALDWAAGIWHRFREGDAELAVCVNNGPDDISLQDTPREHMCSCVWRDGSYNYMLLDLVFEPGEMTLLGMLGERKQEFLLWMKGLVALYKLDTDASSEKFIRKSEKLAEAREQLFFHNLIAPSGPRGKLEITQQGRRAIGRLIEEQEELIELFDVYRDVVLRTVKAGGFAAEFATLSGGDYRVAAYKHQDVDPFRAVFILVLLSGELDEVLKGKDWLEKLNDERFYEGLLAPVVDHAALEPEEVEELVAQGTQYLARTAALRERASYSQGVLRRSKTIQAFPRPAMTAQEGDEAKQKPFVRASKSAPSDELGDPPLPGQGPGPALPPLVAAPSTVPPRASPAARGAQGPVTRSTRRFRGPARGTVAPLRPMAPPPDQGKKDDDDGWL